MKRTSWLTIIKLAVLVLLFGTSCANHKIHKMHHRDKYAPRGYLQYDVPGGSKIDNSKTA